MSDIDERSGLADRRLTDIDFNGYEREISGGSTLAAQRTNASLVDANPTKAPEIYTLREFRALQIPPREMLLSPIIPEKGLVMVYSKRGVGKTHFALGVALAVAGGTKFLQWEAPRPRKVLLVDGEMPAKLLQERLGGQGVSDAPTLCDENLRILAADTAETGLPDLSTPQGQKRLEDLWGEPPDLLILDNLSTLAFTPRDNDADSWTPLQEWLLSLRRRGISVLIVHHANKSGGQRGTSRREDILDTVIELRQPADYDPSNGAQFEIHINKCRGSFGVDVEPFQAHLQSDQGCQKWVVCEVEGAIRRAAMDLLDEGFTTREVEEKVGVPKSTVARWRKQNQVGGGSRDRE